jgi:hypothetical protein
LQQLRLGGIIALEDDLQAEAYESALAWVESLHPLVPGSSPEWEAHLAAVYATICEEEKETESNEAISTACEQAAGLSLGWDDPLLSRDVCLRVGRSEQAELARPHCTAALEMALSEPELDPLIILPLCTLRDTPALADVGENACAQADELRLLAGEVRPGQTVFGTIESVQGEYWLLNGRAGQTLSIRMNKEGSELDSLVELYDTDGQYLTFDDDGGGDMNSWIDAYRLSETGPYFVHTDGYMNSTGAYELILRLSALNPRFTESD